MPSPATVELLTSQAQAAGARSTLYKVLAGAFRAPSPALVELVRGGELAEQVGQAVAALPYALAADGAIADGAGVGPEALEDAYLALFEVGGPQGGPCFLYEGEYGGGRMKVLDEALRFYHYFGLQLDEGRRERPDHLATELEFMHALTFHEALAVQGERSTAALRQGQRDFLRLHMEPFVASVAEKVGGSGAAFYPALARLAASFCRSDLEHLEAGG